MHPNASDNRDAPVSLELVPGLTPDNLAELIVPPHALYPNLKFCLSEDQLITSATSVVAITDASRLSNVFKAIDGAVDSDEFAHYTDRGFRKEQLNKAASYLTAKNKVNGVERSRRDLIDFDATLGETLADLAEENHPVAQMIVYLATHFHDETLSSSKLKSLCYDLLIIAEWSVISEKLDQQVQAYKRKAKQ